MFTKTWKYACKALEKCGIRAMICYVLQVFMFPDFKKFFWNPMKILKEPKKNTLTPSQSSGRNDDKFDKRWIKAIQVK